MRGPPLPGCAPSARAVPGYTGRGWAIPVRAGSAYIVAPTPAKATVATAAAAMA
jgi:hypothetical protein